MNTRQDAAPIHPLASIAADGSYDISGLGLVADATPYTLTQQGIPASDVEAADCLRAVFHLRAEGFSDEEIAADMPSLFS